MLMKMLFMVCCNYCSTRSMWCAVVNSIPCLVKWILVFIFLICLTKYGTEWLKVWSELQVKKDKAIVDANNAKKNAEEALKNEKSSREEKQMKERIQFLTNIAEEKKRLCEAYKGLLNDYSAKVDKVSKKKEKS